MVSTWPYGGKGRALSGTGKASRTKVNHRKAGRILGRVTPNRKVLRAQEPKEGQYCHSCSGQSCAQVSGIPQRYLSDSWSPTFPLEVLKLYVISFFQSLCLFFILLFNHMIFSVMSHLRKIITVFIRHTVTNYLLLLKPSRVRLLHLNPRNRKRFKVWKIRWL